MPFDAGGKNMKKVLIVTYYWPPSGGPGVQRWLKFVKYLRDFDIDPVVYVPENPHYPQMDPSFEAEIPSEITIVKKPIFEPYTLAGILSERTTEKISSGIIPDEKEQGLLQKSMLFIRGNLFIPDARKFWVRPSVKFLSKYMQEHKIDTIITTGPPHSLHLIGLKLKKKRNIKWIADFRDPWTQIGYHKKMKLLSAAEKKHKKLEKEVLNSADRILTTSFTTKEDFEKITSVPIEVITNGYDTQNSEGRPPDQKFTLAHIGSMLSGRNPEELWQALRELVAENEDFKEDFQLKLIGIVGEPILKSLDRHDLEKHVVVKKYVPHYKAIQYQKSAQLLLLIEIDSEDTKGIIPGKLFEYMVSQRPILALGPGGAEFAKIIRETNTGAFFQYSEKDQIKTFLKERYEEYKQGNLQSHPIGLQKYSRKALTGELAAIIKRL